jgi:large subunit ribosomal protein L32
VQHQVALPSHNWFRWQSFDILIVFAFSGWSSSMAVQQNKKSPSKRGMHRAHDFVSAPATAIEPTTGEVHLRHHVSATGFYRGKKVVKTKSDE